VFTIVKDNAGSVTRSCAPVGKFGCPNSGSW
jgi:hypothetical protein